MPIFDTAPQSSGGWLAARRGNVTASRLNDVMAFTKKNEPTEARRKYQYDVLAERLCDYAVDHFVTKEMEHGMECEPLARDRYEEETGNLVMQVGFALHDTIPYFGASSDGLVGKDGMIEIKCCTTPNHMQILISREIPERFKYQMIGQCLVLNRTWCDFCAFDPRLPYEMQIFIKRFIPTPQELKAVSEGVIKFNQELDWMFEQMTVAPADAMQKAA